MKLKDKITVDRIPPILDKRFESIKQYTSNEYAVYMSQAIDFLKICHIRNQIKTVDVSPLIEKKGNFVIIYTSATEKGIYFDIQFLSRLSENLMNLIMPMLKRNMHRFSKSAYYQISKIETEFNKKNAFLDTDLTKIKVLTSEDEALRDIRALISKAKKLQGAKMLDYFFDATSLITLRKLDSLYLFKISTNKNDKRRPMLQKLVLSQKVFKSFKEFAKLLKKTLLIIAKESDIIAKDASRLFGFIYQESDIEDDLKKEWFDLSRGTVTDDSFLAKFEFESASDSIKKLNIEDFIKSIKFKQIKEDYEYIKNNDKIPNKEKHTEYLKQLKLINSQLKDIKNIYEKLNEDDFLTKIEKLHKNKYISQLKEKEESIKNISKSIKDFVFNNKKEYPDYPLPPYLEREYDQIYGNDKEKDSQKAMEILNSFYKEIEEDLLSKENQRIKQDQIKNNFSDISELISFITKINGYIKICTYEDREFIDILRLNIEPEDYEDILLKLLQKGDFLKQIRQELYDMIIDNFLPLTNFPENISKEILSRMNEKLLSLFYKGDITDFNLNIYKDKLESSLKNESPNTAYANILDLYYKVNSFPSIDTIINDLKISSEGESGEKRIQRLKELKDDAHELEQGIRRNLRDILPSVSQSERKERFQIYGIDSIESASFEIYHNNLMADFHDLSSLAEINLKIDELAYLEKKVIHAQEKCLKNSPVEKNIIKQMEKNLIDKKLGEMMLNDLKENLNDLTPLLHKINNDLKELKDLKEKFKDSSEEEPDDSGSWEDLHESVITINDINILKKTYNFLPEASIEDMKQFAYLYNKREEGTTVWLKENINKKPKEAEKYNDARLLEIVTEEAIKKFQEEHIIPINLKIRMFIESDDALGNEINILMKVAEIVEIKAFPQKSFFKNWIKMISYIASGNSEEMKKWIKAVISDIQKKNTEFKSEFWQDNFNANSKKLVIESLKVISR